MVGVAQQACGRPVGEPGEHRLAVGERAGREVVAVQMQQVEDEEEKGVVTMVAQRRLQSVEAGDAVGQQRHQLAVEQKVAMAEGGDGGGDGGQAGGPIQAVAGDQLDGAALAPGEQPVAVELDLADPLVAVRRDVCGAGELGFRRHAEFAQDSVGRHLATNAWLSHGGRLGGLDAGFTHAGGNATLGREVADRSPAGALPELFPRAGVAELFSAQDLRDASHLSPCGRTNDEEPRQVDLPTPAPDSVEPSPRAETHEGAEYAIGASVSLQERRFRTLKAGDMFGVFDQSGNVLPSRGGTEGIYWRDTRYLSAFDLLINDCRPMLLSSTLRDDNGTLTVDLTNPDLVVGREQSLEHDVIHLRRSRFLWAGCCYERLSVRNYSDADQQVSIDIRFGADFADLFEVRGMARHHHGEHHAPRLERDTAILSYTGLDKRRRETRLRFDPQPAVLEPDRAHFVLALPAHGRALVFIEIACDAAAPANSARQNFLRQLVESRRWMRSASANAAAIATSNEVFNEAMRRSISDLYMLVTDKPTGPYPYAGVPWFSAAFGRDALITAHCRRCGSTRRWRAACCATWR